MAAGVALLELFVLEGDESGMRLAGAAGFEPTIIEPHVLERLAGTESPRGPVAVIGIPELVAPSRDAVVLEVTDPGNAGTIVRTAAAFGFDVVARSGSTDLWSPKVLRAGAGAHFRTRICSAGPASTIAAVIAGGVESRRIGEVLDVDRRWSILIGSEPHGLSREAVAAADVRVTIPMPGETESLNASVAAAIVMYELAELRRAQ